MEQIVKLWFEDNRIFILTKDGFEKSRPLEAFPRLKDASEEDRYGFEVWDDGHSIRWEKIDEDIHISSFNDSTEPNPDNEVARLIEAGGVMDLDAFAKLIGMKKFKLDLFRYGIWTPSLDSLQKIKDGIRHIESQMVDAL